MYRYSFPMLEDDNKSKGNCVIPELLVDIKVTDTDVFVAENMNTNIYRCIIFLEIIHN